MTDVTDPSTLRIMARNTWETAIIQKSQHSSPRADHTFGQAIQYAQKAIDNSPAGYHRDQSIRLRDMILQDSETGDEKHTARHQPQDTT